MDKLAFQPGHCQACRTEVPETNPPTLYSMILGITMSVACSVFTANFHSFRILRYPLPIQMQPSTLVYSQAKKERLAPLGPSALLLANLCKSLFRQALSLRRSNAVPRSRDAHCAYLHGGKETRILHIHYRNTR